MFAHIPSLQLVTSLPNSTKSGAKGHLLVWGPWADLVEHSQREFHPNLLLTFLGTDGLGCPFFLFLSVELVLF